MKGTGYRGLAAVGLVVIGAAQFVVVAAAQSEYFLGVFGLVALVLAAVAWRFDRWFGTAPAAIGAVLMLAQGAFMVPSLGRFASGLEFFWSWMTLTTSVFVLVFALADLAARKRHASGRPGPAVVRAFAGVTVAIVIAGAASGIATVTNRSTVSASDRQGAIEVTYKDVAVVQKQIAVKAGEPVRIVVDNKDVVYHDFDVKGQEINIGLNPKESKIVAFTIATPGSYTYRCTVHPEMKGTLVVR
ncbi:MAG TPA: cupredoxin domain-containing protein [Dehalococcoidia bacterium]|nr:cupredoxin domain-containing protein [Dehalococcoidia bacterium]